MAANLFRAETIDRFIGQVQGTEHAAGLVVEETRVRFAEFHARKSGDKGRVLEREGAALLSPGVIREGELTDPMAFTQALKQLRESGEPRALAATQVVLSLPLSQAVGKAFTLPPNIKRSEWDSALRIEAERTLPFPFEETFFDWQELQSEKTGEKTALNKAFFLAARKTSVQAYVAAVQAAGLGVLAVEPITMSIARGLQNRSGVSYTALFHSDVLFVAAVDVFGNMRAFHHRALPTVKTNDAGELKRRAQMLANELASFIRFYRAESGERENEQEELVVDGTIEGEGIAAIEALARTFSLPLRYDPKAHVLSQAAARGAGLRAIVPRAEDHMISLMEQGTEATFTVLRSAFFYRTAAVTVLGTLAIASLLLGGTALYLASMEGLQRNVQPKGQAAIGTVSGDIERFNATITQTVALLPSRDIPPDFFDVLLSSLPKGVSADQVEIRAQGAEASTAGVAPGITVSFSGRISDVDAYDSFLAMLHERFTDTPLSVPADLQFTRPTDIPVQIDFSLR